MQQGTRANYTGNALERFIISALERKDYTRVDAKKFDPSRYLEQPIYARFVVVGKNIYGSDSKVDFAIYHPQKHPKCLIIESKWQESGGTVDEKYPFLVLNIQFKYPYKTILVLDGGGYRPGAFQWIKEQVKNNLVAVMNMGEFQKWANSDRL